LCCSTLCREAGVNLTLKLRTDGSWFQKKIKSFLGAQISKRIIQSQDCPREILGKELSIAVEVEGFVVLNIVSSSVMNLAQLPSCLCLF